MLGATEEPGKVVGLLTQFLFPQEADCRARLGDRCVDPRCHFHAHKKSCGGEYIKVMQFLFDSPIARRA